MQVKSHLCHYVERKHLLVTPTSLEFIHMDPQRVDRVEDPGEIIQLHLFKLRFFPDTGKYVFIFIMTIWTCILPTTTLYFYLLLFLFFEIIIDLTNYPLSFLPFKSYHIPLFVLFFIIRIYSLYLSILKNKFILHLGLFYKLQILLLY